MLALLGGVAGLLLAYWAQSALWSFRPPFLQPDAIDINPDLRVLLFTLGIALATGLLFGLAPALQRRADLVTELKENRARQPLAALSASQHPGSSQVALSLVALIGAGYSPQLAAGAADRAGLRHRPPGGDVVRSRRAGIHRGARASIPTARGERSALPGVESATLAGTVPLFNGGFSRRCFSKARTARIADRDGWSSSPSSVPGISRRSAFRSARPQVSNSTSRTRRRPHRQRNHGEHVLAQRRRDRQRLTSGRSL